MLGRRVLPPRKERHVMQFKFLHAADIHLGYQQYGLVDRYDDFTEGFQWIIETALRERVAFLLIAGDLFEKRTLDPRTLLIAVKEFQRLKDAGIPVVAIEGNHERTYGENLSWLDYLKESELLYLLDCSRREDGWVPRPWHEIERTGGYVDIGDARIYGLRYQGAQTGAALDAIGGAIAAAPPPESMFSVFLAHTSVEGFFDQGHPFVRQQDLSWLRRCVDYLALGHIHVPYRDGLGAGEWLFNPGCPETWSSEERQYREKGAILVDVDVNQEPNLKATALDYPYRRPFVHVRQELDACPSPSTLLALLEEKIRREPQLNPVPAIPSPLVDAGTNEGSSFHRQKRPVVEIVLTGVARFSRTEIDTAAIEQLAKLHFDPLVVRVRSSLQEAPADLVEESSSLDRPVLERMVFESLIRADDRFAGRTADLAQLTAALKQMVVDGVAASDIAEEMQERLHGRPQQNLSDDTGAPGDAAFADSESRPAVEGVEDSEEGGAPGYVQQDFLAGTVPEPLDQAESSN